MTIQTLLVPVPVALITLAALWQWLVHLAHQKKESHHHHGAGHQHGGSIFSIDLYAYNSKIANWNPSFKVAFSIILLLFCVIADNLYVSILVITITTYVTVVLGGLSFRDYLSLMAIPITFLIVGSIVILLNFSTTPLSTYLLSFDCRWFYITITESGLHTTINLWGKAFGAVSAMYMMSLSTPSSEIFTVLRKMHVPKMIVELMNIMYRYIFILMDTQARMKNSAESRLGYTDFKTALYTFGHTASNLLIVSLKKASSYYDAMESRCYDGELLFLQPEKPVKTKQVVAAVLLIAYLILVWILTK